MSYAFTFDASACSGCKACQVACKDKNNLPEGVFWRRVIEVSGGEWQHKGPAWENSVFAYNLSLACNHCVHPKCAGVCPTNAFSIRPDGIVLLNSAICVGCGYCNWACPYAVPQYNPLKGYMSKCNFCFDALDAGLPPTCVAACPMRVLDYIEISEAQPSTNGLPLWEIPGKEHPFPLPDYSRTQPHLLLRPHAAMSNSLKKTVANGEEIKSPVKNEMPLVLFTLLVQMAVGAYWAVPVIFGLFWGLIESDNTVFRIIPLLLVAFCLGLGALVSFRHLGNRRNAWRVLSHLKKSWLSREILFLGLFGSGVIASLVFPSDGLYFVTSALGFGLIYSMANVYMLRSISAWNSRRTLAAFLLSALLLGQFMLIPVFLVETTYTGILLSPGFLGFFNGLCALLLVVEGLLMVRSGRHAPKMLPVLRGSLIVIVLLSLLGALFSEKILSLYWYLSLFLVIIIEESLGRWLFYAVLGKRTL